MTLDIHKLRAAIPDVKSPFAIRKIGHVVIKVTDLQRSLAFYAGVLGFKVSDILGEDMMKGGMVFMRCNADHHGVALVGGAPGPSERHELHHMAFEVGSLDEVFRARDHLQKLEASSTQQRVQLILAEALGLGEGTVINPSGGPLVTNVVMAAGLARIGEAATRITRGDANRAVAHATSGPCLQQNMVCVLEADA